MRALRSRTVGNSSSLSDASINKSVPKKKTKSRRTKLDLTKDTAESSDTDSVFTKSTVGNSSSLSEANIDKSAPNKKTRSQRTKLDLTKDPTDSSDADVFNKSTDCENVQPVKPSRKTKKIKAKTQSDPEIYLSTPIKLNANENNTFPATEDKEGNLNDVSIKGTSKKKKERFTGNASSFRVMNSTFENDPTLDKTSGVCEKNSTFEVADVKESKNIDISLKSVSRLSESQKFINLVNKSNENLDNESIPEGLLKTDLSSSNDSLNKTLTYDPNCITIDDSTDVFKAVHLHGDTFEKSAANISNIGKNATFDKDATYNKNNSTFEKVNTSLTQKLSEDSRRGTYQIKNSSGQWSIDDIYADYLNETKNDSTDVVHLHKKTIPSTSIINVALDTPTKSNRKKWVKFETENVESPILRNSTFFETKVAHSSTPFEKKFPVTPARLNKSTHSGKKNNTINQINSTSKNIKKSVTKAKIIPNLTPARINKSLLSAKDNSIIQINSTSKSNKKSIIKAKAMPNFALIHQKANEKIESIKDYSERKKERAQKLLSGEKPIGDKENHKNNVVKSTLDLFGSSEQKNIAGTPKSLPIQGVFKLQSNKKQPITPKPEKAVVKRKEFVSKLPPLKSYLSKSHAILPKTPRDDSTLKISFSLKNQTVSNLPETKTSTIRTATKNNQENKINKTGISTITSKNTSKYSESKKSASKSVLKNNQDNNKSKTELSTKSNKCIVIKPTTKPVPIFSKGLIPISQSKSEIDSKVDTKPVSVFSKGHCMAIANKTKTTDKLGNRDNRRDQIKGVRSNRRFDLLMQMRSNM